MDFQNAASAAFDTNCLSPGYVRKGFSYVRSEMYAWAETQNTYLGIPIFLLSTASKWVEFPIRVIEDIALILINLVGSIFSEGCKNNLNEYLIECIAQDIIDAAVIGVFALKPISLYSFITCASIIGYIFLNVFAIIENKNPILLGLGKTNIDDIHNKKNLLHLRKEIDYSANTCTKFKNYELYQYYKIEAIHKQGSSNVFPIVHELRGFGDYETISKLSENALEIARETAVVIRKQEGRIFATAFASQINS